MARRCCPCCCFGHANAVTPSFFRKYHNAIQSTLDITGGMSDLTLRQELLQADAAVAEVLEMSGKDSQRKLRDVLALLQNAQAHARMAGVISPNEEAREVSGKNLEFVLLNWNIAQLLSRCILETDGSREAFDASLVARKSFVSRAILSIEAFIVQLQQLRLITAEDEKFMHFDSGNASGRRERKIALFRRTKAASEQLDQAKARHERLIQLRSAPKIWTGSASGGRAAAAEDGDDDWEEEGDSEEAHRAFVLAKIHSCMFEAMDSYGGLKDELELLDSRPTEVLGRAPSGRRLAAAVCRECSADFALPSQVIFFCRKKNARSWLQRRQGNHVHLAPGQVTRCSSSPCLFSLNFSAGTECVRQLLCRPIYLQCACVPHRPASCV